MINKLKIAFFVSLVLYSVNLIAAIPAIQSYRSIAQPVWAKHGMVASQEALASKIGVDILKQGGNAIDAAVAVGYALAVTLPRAGNIGGGGFMLVYLADEKKTIAIDYRETAPSASHREMFLDQEGNAVASLSRFHGKAVGVPGTVMGLNHALKQYGTMPLEKVIKPAIQLAENGIPVTFSLHSSLKGMQKRLSADPASADIFYPKGEPLQASSVWRQPALAATLKTISKKGDRGFYKGPIAENLVATVQRNGGIMSLDDLANYQVKIRKPVKGRYQGFDIVSMSPPSSGGVHIIQMLNMLENAPLREYQHNSADAIHVMAESMKRAYADRSVYLGDPDYVSVPVDQLTSKAYAKSLFAKIDMSKATPSKAISAGDLNDVESNETTHFSVVDRWGNAVSNTYTLNFSYGAGITVPEHGFLLNNEMDDFSVKPGTPNGYGLIGGEANAVGSNKRPLSSMSPTFVLDDDGIVLVTGSPGGSRIITTTLQIILNVLSHDMNIAEASQASRVHHQWLPDELRIERGVSKDTVSILRARGHHVVEKSSMGSTQSILRTDAGLFGASDPRRGGAAALGYSEITLENN